MGGLSTVQHSVGSFETVFLLRDAGPYALAGRSRTRWQQGLWVISWLDTLESRARWLQLATRMRERSLACCLFVLYDGLGTVPRLGGPTSYYTQEYQFVEADIQARALQASMSRLPHSRQKQQLRLSITAMIIRCLTSPLIRFPRRLSRSRPADETPRTPH